ncbi:hypothetical protein [Flindersiella endophytica]
MALSGFGVTEFQLVLLRRMQDYQPELVEAARAQLGVTRTEQRDANAHWQRLVRSRNAPGGLRRFRLVLGEPEGRSTVHIGDMPCLIHQWRFPLWPDLRWEVLTGPDNREIHSWLVRAPGEPVPPLPTSGRLEPWSCVVSDVEQTYASVRHHEGSAPSRWTVEFEANDGKVWLARFVHGLVQAVDDPPPMTAR